MIEALLSFTKEGLLIRVSLTGHAGAGAKGMDLICASVSHLIRTAAAVLMRLAPGCRYSTRGEGDFILDLSLANFGRKDEIAGVLDFLLTGLKLLAAENPDSIRVKTQEGE